MATSVEQSKSVERSVQEGEDLFRTMANCAPVLLWMAGRDKLCVFFNQGWLSFTGRSLEQEIGNGWAQGVHPDDMQLCLETYYSAFDARQPFKMHYRLRRHDGEYRWILDAGAPHFAPNGEFRGYVGSAVDVSDQKQVEESNQRLAHLQRLAVIGELTAVITHELRQPPTGIISHVNVAANLSESANPPLSELREITDNIGRKLVEAKLHEGEDRFRTHDEELARASEVLKEAIATHQCTVQELERTRRFLDLVVENIPAMLFVKDAKDNRFVLMNRAGEELLGYDRTELIGKNDYDFFPKEQADLFVTKDREVLSSGKLWIIPEERVESRTKGTRLLQTKKMPVFDVEGRPAYLLGLSEDITERKAAEQQLQQALKMEAIGQLTGGVAHDFNNLLTVILSNAQTLSKLLTDDDDRELAEMIETAAVRGSELINQLLAFARRQPLEPRAVDIEKLVKGMDGLLRRVLGEDIEIELVHCAGLWEAMVDPAQLESALLNLCLNARDAMQHGGQLTIDTRNAEINRMDSEAHHEMGPGQYVLLGISDTGIGMTSEVMARVFEPFFSTKKVGTGTGLGLSMVYGFVKQSGGHIESYSEVGRGSSFKIYLPRALATEAAAAVRRPQEFDDPVGNETILVVEDDNLVRRHAQRMLHALGYQVLIASNGPEAMAILERGDHVDILFTDVVMPGRMGGRQLADKAAALRPSLKILFTSGYAEDAIVNHGRLDPGVHLIKKPYRRQELALKLRQLLGPAQPR